MLFDMSHVMKRPQMFDSEAGGSESKMATNSIKILHFNFKFPLCNDNACIYEAKTVLLRSQGDV